MSELMRIAENDRDDAGTINIAAARAGMSSVMRNGRIAVIVLTLAATGLVALPAAQARGGGGGAGPPWQSGWHGEGWSCGKAASHRM